jgi:predicted CopG family antitoxin
VAKQIKVSNQVYEKLRRLRQELGMVSYSYVLDELIETYERMKALNISRSILPLLDELRKTLALIDRELHTKRADVDSKSIEKKSAQKGELISYMRR